MSVNSLDCCSIRSSSLFILHTFSLQSKFHCTDQAFLACFLPISFTAFLYNSIPLPSNSYSPIWTFAPSHSYCLQYSITTSLIFVLLLRNLKISLIYSLFSTGVLYFIYDPTRLVSVSMPITHAFFISAIYIKFI